MSEDHKRKISKAKKGIAPSEEHRRNLSIANKGTMPWILGKHHSDETKRKMSESKMGPKNPNYGNPAWNRGKKRSDEAKRRMSSALKGKIPWNRGLKTGPLSDEHKRKILEARREFGFPLKDTSIEVAMQAELDGRGIVYEKHIPVCGVCIPDIVFPSKMVAVFADGNYWHSKEFKDGKVWERDRRQDRVLGEAGWRVLRFWGNEIREDISLCIDKVEGLLG